MSKRVGEGEKHPQQVFDPIEEVEVPFRGHTIRAVKLADERLCVVLRPLCERIYLDAAGQIQRISRTPAIANELLMARVKTKGGRQPMAVLTLRGYPTWILGINPGEIGAEKIGDEADIEEVRQLILAYQVEAVDALYSYFARRVNPAALPAPAIQAAPSAPGIPMLPTEEPTEDAPDDELATYHEKMALYHRWKADYHMQLWRQKIRAWQGGVEDRLEGEKALTDMIPEIIDRLPPETITPEHQNLVKYYISQWSQASGKHSGTLYSQLYTAFQVPRYQELREADWEQVKRWFQDRIEEAKMKR